MSGISAELNRYNQSPRKVRLLADLIRGKSAEMALAILSLGSKRGSLPMKKLLNSAIANAKNNAKAGTEDLYVKSVTVDGGLVMKRGMPRAFGRSFPIRRRTSNIKLVLDFKKGIKK